MTILLVAISLLAVAPSSGLTSWEPIGSGVDAPVCALTIYQGELIADGYFIKATTGRTTSSRKLIVIPGGGDHR